MSGPQDEAPADDRHGRGAQAAAPVTGPGGPGPVAPVAWPRAVLLLVLLAVAVRVAWVLLVPTRPVGDFAMYLESAAHLLAHGQLDPEFVYMPGYVILVAGLQAFGGGVLAVKLFGALLAGAATAPVYVVGAGLFGRAAGLLAAGAYAVWPGGIAVSSVTGTDLPTAVLIVTAVSVLVAWADARPWRAALGFGLVMGLAAWVRAVAVPLAALSVFYFLARRHGLWRSVRLATAAAAVALAVLAPWGLRNRARYGEWFITDSHGGLTALVGANPNTDGRYSRSLNRLFAETTGYTLLREPHREADRASYVLAREFTAFEPAYAFGLVLTKLERLLASERPLLYWPVYRAGVLAPETRAFFDRHRSGLERLVDRFWAALVFAAVFGVCASAAARRFGPLSLLPLPIALVAIYALFFAEARYHLPIAILLFPLAGGGVAWLGTALRALSPEAPHAARRAVGVQAAAGLVAVCVLGVGWPALVRQGAALREAHRWAAHVCDVEGRRQVCKWKATERAAPDRSGVQGIWDGVGLEVPRPPAGATTPARAVVETGVPARSGHPRLRAVLDVAPLPRDAVLPSATVSVWVGRVPEPVLRVSLEDLADATEGPDRGLPFEVTAPLAGGPLRVALAIEGAGTWPERAIATRVWLHGLVVE